MNSICFDTETTGLHPNGSDPDEIGDEQDEKKKNDCLP